MNRFGRCKTLWKPVVSLTFLALAACTQQELLEKFSSPEDQAVAKGYIDKLRARKFDEIEKDLDSSIRTADIRGTLTRMADLIPSGEPTSVKLVGAHSLKTTEASTVNTTFEYNFGERWLLANVAVRDRNGSKTIVGFNINPRNESLESQNRFTLVGKSTLQYAVLFGAVAAALITLYSLVVCIRTRPLRRKWLWVLFIVFGVGDLAVNWATGEWKAVPLSAQLFSASATAPFYGAWTIGFSFPLGALWFLFHRRSLAAGSRAS